MIYTKSTILIIWKAYSLKLTETIQRILPCVFLQIKIWMNLLNLLFFFFFLSKITKNKNKLIKIMGDYNINLLNKIIYIQTADFIDTILSYSTGASLNHKAFGNLLCNSQKSFHTSPGPYDSNNRGYRSFFKVTQQWHLQKKKKKKYV